MLKNAESSMMPKGKLKSCTFEHPRLSTFHPSSQQATGLAQDRTRPAFMEGKKESIFGGEMLV